MTDKVCLITGATSGIGLAAAQELANQGMTLVIHGRDAVKLKVAHDAILAESDQAVVHTLKADFSSLDEVRDMAAEFAERFERLDILFNNAGVLTDHRQTSADGFELTFAVNHLAPMLLTWSLLPKLRASAPARIMFNSSSALGDAQLNLDDLQSERWHSGWAAYANTKLANMLMSKLLAEQLADEQIACNSFCPGLIDTGLLKDNREFDPMMVEHINKRARSPADGAMTAIYLATAPEAQNLSGAFFLKSHGEGKQPVQFRWDRPMAEQLWKQSADLLTPWLAVSATKAG